MSDGEEYASFSKSEVMPISSSQQKDTLSHVLVRTIMHFKSFHWLSRHSISAIIQRSTNMVSTQVNYFGVFILVQFSIFWVRFNKTISPLVHVGYEMIIANSTLRTSLFTPKIQFGALHPISAAFRMLPPFECVFINKRPHSNKHPNSNIIILL